MKSIFTYLTHLGFSQIESKLYLLLLKSGPMTVAELAGAAKINRTATYSHINSLLQKGIIAKAKGSTNQIVANPPEHLQYLVEQKITSVMTLKETLPNVIKVLNTSYPQIKNDKPSEITYYKGKTGVKMIYKEALKSDRIRAYFNPKDIEAIFPENIVLFNNIINQNPNMIVLELVQRSPEAIIEITNSHATERHIYKFLPEDIKLTANDILIYDGNVAIINIGDKNNITGVVLHNREYYNNSVQLFDLLWRLLPDPSL